MAIKKSELYSSLWESCDSLRGGMDASQYKDYVLVLLFVKYISDRYAGKKDALIEVPKGASFDDMARLAGDKEIGDKINKIIAKIFEANSLTGVAFADFNDPEKLGKGKEMVDRLSDLVRIFNKPELNFKGNRAEDDDLLGDAYEYLMRHFATESGKSKGQFYTPAEVSRVMAQVLGLETVKNSNQTIYDPTCGSGSLLLKAHDEAKHVSGHDLALYGQEKDNATTSLAKMNMILHGCPTAVHEIVNGNTLANPGHKKEGTEELKTFDFIVANPPFSDKKWQNGLLGDDKKVSDNYKRFEYGIPPAKNGDYAYLLHLLKSLKSTGKGVIVMPHGVLFRGNVEAQIRENLLRRGYIKGIIGLPANLFYGTGIPACLIIIDKDGADSRKSVFMIDASKGFIKDGNKNRLREQDIHRIVDAFKKVDESNPKFARMIPIKEIEANEFNLNIPRYIDSTEPEDLQDIEAHLLGGIPNSDIDELNEYWKLFPSLRKALFEDFNRPGYSELKVERDQIRNTVFEHTEFTSYAGELGSVFDIWREKHTLKLKELKAGVKPRAVIHEIGESLLSAYSGKELINQYDVYQHLMTYWDDVMKDDVYMIIKNGWKAEVQEVVKEKGKQKNKVEGSFKIGKKEYVCELIPTNLVIDRYFADDWAGIQELEAKKESIAAEKEELEEEHSGDEGVLEDLKNDKGKITKGNIQDRVKEIRQDGSDEFDDELAVLKQYLTLIDLETSTNKDIKDGTEALLKKVLKKHSELNENEIRTLVVDDKWMRRLQMQLDSEISKISQRIADRAQELSHRYENPLPKISIQVEELSSNVDQHLQAMGFTWTT